MKDRVELLIAHNANLNRYCHYYLTYPVMEAVQSRQYDVALLMLKAGADFRLYQPDGERKIIHTVFRDKERLQPSTPEKHATYQALVDWLEQHGESLASAEADEDRWAAIYKKKAFDPASSAKVRQQIIHERNAQQNSKSLEAKP